MFHFTFDLADFYDGTGRAERYLAQGWTFPGLQDDVSAILSAQTLRAFEEQQSPSGETWPRLSAVTLGAHRYVSAGGERQEVGRREGSLVSVAGQRVSLQDRFGLPPLCSTFGWRIVVWHDGFATCSHCCRLDYEPHRQPPVSTDTAAAAAAQKRSHS